MTMLKSDNTQQINKGSGKKMKAENSILDLAFALDCTSSMGSYIQNAKTNIRQIVEEIVSSEGCDIHLALVEYRDHPPEDSSFITRVNDFTGSVSKMKKWLENCEASGGGDIPEAVADALHDLTKLSWRLDSTKICVFIADAPPHGLSLAGDGFPDGCPAGLDPMKTVRQLAEKGITLYMVGCEPSIDLYKSFFTALAHITGGQYVPLSHANLLTQVIVGGAREEISLDQLMAEVHQDVCQEAAWSGIVDEEDLSTRLHEKLKVKGVKTQHLMMNNSALAEASVEAKELSGMCDMSAVRKKFSPSSSFQMMLSSAVPPPTRGFGSLMAAPPPAGGFGPPMAVPPLAGGFSPPLAACNAAFDSYSNAESEISYNQVQRMVRKSVMQQNLNKS